MNGYAIRIEEIIGKTVVIEAKNSKEAIRKATELYKKGNINVGYELSDVEIAPSKYFGRNGIVKDNDDITYYEVY